MGTQANRALAIVVNQVLSHGSISRHYKAFQNQSIANVLPPSVENFVRRLYIQTVTSKSLTRMLMSFFRDINKQ